VISKLTLSVYSTVVTASEYLLSSAIAASCGTVVFIYLLALKWFGQLAARFAALLFPLSPLARFHGIVALTYGVEAFFSALVGYLC
jgi:4-amino-4-deoxy-L-arabinose transferase-like glycosyltransferase